MNRFIASIPVIALLVGIGLPVMAQDTPNVACIQNAISQRDLSIMQGWNTYYVSTTTALNTRRAELMSAWLLTDKTQRKNTIKGYWQNYRNSLKTAKIIFKDARKNAWNQYKDAIKGCGERSSEARMGSGEDNRL